MHALRRLAASLRRGNRTEVKKVYVASSSDELLEEPAGAVHQPLPATGPAEVPEPSYVDNAAAWSQASGTDEVMVEEVEDDIPASPASLKASPSLPALPGRARASFGEDLRNGYESRARDREAWLSSLSSRQAVPEDAPVQRMTAKELLALASAPEASPRPEASPGRSLREPSEVFNEQLKRWNVHMKAKDGGEDRWNGNVRMTWSIRMS
ncbi:unnamed protein product [Symbiodinium sp. CCMP2592]|nr:unnamed protein product [Symbiodinium sp. CCMP2592]